MGMASLPALEARLALITEQSYYEILRVPSGAPAPEIKAAFHEFALDCHPDCYVDAPGPEAAVAAEIFKRGVEAYKVLSKRELRERYDEGLLRGKLRHVEGRKSVPPPAPRMLTLEEVAIRPKAKQLALKADRMITAGRLDEARIALVTAIQEDYDNDDLKERLNALLEAIALEPLSLEVDYGPRR
jgi:curved DNA-binding protein CbpA